LAQAAGFQCSAFHLSGTLNLAAEAISALKPEWLCGKGSSLRSTSFQQRESKLGNARANRSAGVLFEIH
jgi:hypothetical protein